MKNIYSPSYYQILCIKSSATLEQIKSSWRKLMKQFHPDLNPNNLKYATEKSVAINEAYEVLSNPTEKNKYDFGLNAFIQRENEAKRKKENAEQKATFSHSYYKHSNADDSWFAVFLLLSLLLRIWENLDSSDRKN